MAGGRPAMTEGDIQTIFLKLEPYLKTGLSLHKACLAAQVPKTTVYDLMEKNNEFSEKVEAARNFLAIVTSDIHYREINRIKKKVEDGIELNEQEINYVKWFSQISKLTRDEFGERKEIEFFDPQSEIQKLMAKINERYKSSDTTTGNDRGGQSA